MPETRLAESPLPRRVHCHGLYPVGHERAGQRCRNPRPIAVQYGEIAIVRDNGRTHMVTATSCPECATVRHFGDSAPAIGVKLLRAEHAA